VKAITSTATLDPHLTNGEVHPQAAISLKVKVRVSSGRWMSGRITGHQLDEIALCMVLGEQVALECCMAVRLVAVSPIVQQRRRVRNLLVSC
jgi:hypothetical protein